MRQKVNPHGLRIGVIKDWDSQWYADDCNESFLVGDCELKIGRIKDWDFQLTAITISKVRNFFICTKLTRFIRAVICDVKKMLILPRRRLLT